MSEAISGVDCVLIAPACRYAHAGYELKKLISKENLNGLRRWICRAGAEEEPEGLYRNVEKGLQGMEGVRRARLQGMRRRRCLGRQGDVVPAQREDEEERDRGLGLH